VDSKALAALESLDSVTPKYRVPLAESYSGPIVSGDNIFVTETKDKKFEVVRCLKRETGEQVWEAQWEGAISVPFFAKANGDWIRATPIVDQGLVYVAGIRDVLVCLRASSGEIVWQLDFVKQFQTPVPDFGFVSSPLIQGDHLYVQAGSAVYKLNKSTGAIVWKAFENQGGMMSGGAFSSPVVGKLCGQEQLVVQSREELAGIDLETGNVLWKQPVPHFRGMNILTPSIIGDRIFTSSYQNGSYLYEITKSGDSYQVKELWKGPSNGYMSSPIIHNGHAYLHLQNQRFTCLDLATGKETWRTKAYGKYWSMIAAGDKILALDERGELFLIKANPEKFELLGQKKVSEESAWAHLGIQGQELYVRELNALSVFRF
jgi:outer membrane protein assembly factor BamB